MEALEVMSMYFGRQSDVRDGKETGAGARVTLSRDYISLLFHVNHRLGKSRRSCLFCREPVAPSWPSERQTLLFRSSVREKNLLLHTSPLPT